MTTTGTETGRLLVVDDDAAVQRVVKRAAEAAGYTVTQAFDGASGLEMAFAEAFDLIILDINMPEVDGRDVLHKLRQNPSTATLPVLVYSGRGEQLDRVALLELGADEYVHKPFEPTLLVSKIGWLLEKKAQERATEPGLTSRRDG